MWCYPPDMFPLAIGFLLQECLGHAEKSVNFALLFLAQMSLLELVRGLMPSTTRV